MEARPRQAWYNWQMKERATHGRARDVKGFTIGRSRFAKISAVEGIRMTDAMDAEFREFDRKHLSPEQRRRAISRKYGKVR